MSRRRLVVLASTLALLALGLVASVVVLGVTHTEYGREQVRTFIMARIAANVQGTMYIGRIGGGLLTGVTIDSLEIRDRDDSLFVASGPITVHYDPRDLIDRRILISYMSVERPVVRLQENEAGRWNFQRIFQGDRQRQQPRQTRGLGLGDYIVIDSLDVRGGEFTLVMPWHPEETLRGARRDSAIAENLAREDAEIRPAGGNYARIRRWTDLHASASYLRLADPDSAGQLVALTDFRVVESDPPFVVSNGRGTARRLGDSLWLNIPRFDLPGSTASGSGKIVWGSGIPVRYAIKIIGDSVSLADVAWVYPTMPTTGGGRMRLDINNERDPRIINYAIYDMDVRTTHSRLRGAMTYGVGGPVLRLTDVALEALPVDFRLIRQFNGAPFPVDWAGTLNGTVRASGGPLDRFIVDDAQVVFRDAHVPGAVSRFTGRGELDILEPALTTFRGFDLEVQQLDLRTPRHVFPTFPALDGMVVGSATLDSVWTDVRFRDADLTHRDGPGETSRLTGRGRVTLEEEFLVYDLVLDAERVAFTTLARSFPDLPLRGSYRGPMRVQGTVEDMGLIASLNGPGGTLAVNGQFDFYPPAFGMRGIARLENVDLRTLLERDDLPRTSLTLSADADLRGDSLADLSGTAGLVSERSEYDWLRIHPSRARLRFADGKVRVDTLVLETTAGQIDAGGALGLVAGRADSLGIVVRVDSLGGLRSVLGFPAAEPVANNGERHIVAEDSLGGMLWFAGALRGSLDSLALSGELRGSELMVGAHRAEDLEGRIALGNVTREPVGHVELRLDSVQTPGVRTIDLAGSLRIDDRSSGRLQLGASAPNGPAARLSADVRLENGGASARVDELAIVADERAPWELSSPVALRIDGDGWSIDSIELRRPGGARVSAAARIPRQEPIEARLVADQLPLSDVGVLAQARAPLDGTASIDIRVSGTRREPRYLVNGTLSDASAGDVNIERLTVGGRYADHELIASMNLFRRQRPVMTAELALPIDLSLTDVERRRGDAPLRGKIRTDSVELGILETFTTGVRNATGRIVTDVDLGGTWEHPVLTGRINIADGALDVPALGIRLERVDADVALAGDSMHIQRISALSRRDGNPRADTASLTGFVRFADLDDPQLGLRFYARNFTVVNRRGLARLDVSTPAAGLQLTGRATSSRLVGSLLLERGEIVIPELVQKRPIDLSDPELYRMVQTTLPDDQRFLPSGPSRFVQGLTLQGVRLIIGDEVWLRSSEANIKLGGEVAVTTDRRLRQGELGMTQLERDGPADRARLALEGTLSADRGTYTLNLGLVRRTFEVDTGRVIFYGDAELNPALDIGALHTVRQYNRQDVRIRVHIGGTLDEPVLTLSSAEGLPISPPVLLSYLVTGQPSVDVGSPTAAASILLPTVGSWFGSQLAGASGGLIDYVQVQTAGVEQGRTFGEIFQNRASLLSGTSLGVGKQLNNRTFVSATAGLCKIVSNDVSFNTSELFSEVVGFKLEHRLNHGFSVEFGSEPASSALLCQPGMRGVVNTPPRLGFDIFRAWTF
ncbi:MAG TPA: translocation/assembly module TamB domain-containing protein [Gemmatimonadaceae bacterium]|nr:translocation/assembly module TamB domain-containing protein [Gemmatimonadaceae bacterium]